MTDTAGKAAVRCKALTMSELAAAESHGKRTDSTSKLRHVRDADPLIFGSLDLKPAFNVHMEGVKQNAGAKKPVLHFLIRFPPELLDEGSIVGKFTGSKLNRQQQMLDQAVAFVNGTHGGEAVFAARLDRNEAGESIVDVFASPKYEKRTKRTPSDCPGSIWASATKYGRELAEKHQEEIKHRHPEAKGVLTGPRAVGIALQSEFAEFFRELNEVPLTAKNQKKTAEPDRLEIEAYKQIQNAHDQIDQDRVAFDAEKAALVQSKADIATDRAQLDVDRKILDQDRSELIADRKTLSGEFFDLEEKRAEQVRELQSIWGMVTHIIRRAGKLLGIDIGQDSEYGALRREMIQADRVINDLSAPPTPEEPVEEADGPGL